MSFGVRGEIARNRIYGSHAGTIGYVKMRKDRAHLAGNMALWKEN